MLASKKFSGEEHWDSGGGARRRVPRLCTKSPGNARAADARVSHACWGKSTRGRCPYRAALWTIVWSTVVVAVSQAAEQLRNSFARYAVSPARVSMTRHSRPLRRRKSPMASGGDD